MTLNERLESRQLKDYLPGAIVDYYRNPSDQKKASILKHAARLHVLEGSGWYLVCIDYICIRILYACDHQFVDFIETELRTV